MRATLLREPLGVAIDPPHAALALRGDDRPFALIGAWAGGGALLGSEPVRVSGPGDDLFALLDALPAVEGGGEGVGGGWFGFLGFEARHRVEPGHPPPPRPVPLPDGALSFYDHLLRMDADGAWWFEALVTDARAEAIARRRDELLARLERRPALRPFAARDWRWTPTPRGHAEVVEACRTRIREGDLFQANLCLRLQGRLEGDAFDLFATAAEALPTDRAAFVAGPWGTVASLSPELFLTRSGRTVRSEPIKGTRPVDRRAELEASAKDRAENVMIVDLVRNDLGRVCRPGSVRVAALAEVRAHAGVWHMVSEVEGELRPGVGDADLLRATFPPGSVTGAPKLAALDVIAELESTGREAYTGAIGFASPLAGLELSVAIRTFEVRGTRIWLGAGGGIVADSAGEEEAARGGREGRPAAGRDRRRRAAGAARRRRPPRRGSPDAARARCRAPTPPPASTRRCWSPPASRGTSPRTSPAWRPACARSTASHRRPRSPSVPAPPRTATSARGCGSTSCPARTPRSSSPRWPEPAPARLRPVVLPGGLGPHKWRDRTLLEAHEGDDPATLPLLLDADGVVLETSRTSIVVEAADGTLHTPPADGRILPGVTVAATGARPRVLTLADLAAARAVHVTSALRGRQPARLV